jgi:hypothetical protein
MYVICILIGGTYFHSTVCGEDRSSAMYLAPCALRYGYIRHLVAPKAKIPHRPLCPRFPAKSFCPGRSSDREKEAFTRPRR